MLLIFRDALVLFDLVNAGLQLKFSSLRIFVLLLSNAEVRGAWKVVICTALSSWWRSDGIGLFG